MEFQIFCRLANSRRRDEILRKFETPIESHSTYKQTDPQTLTDTHRHSQTLTDSPQDVHRHFRRDFLRPGNSEGPSGQEGSPREGGLLPEQPRLVGSRPRK